MADAHPDPEEFREAAPEPEDYVDPERDFSVGDRVHYEAWTHMDPSSVKETGHGYVVAEEDTFVDDGGPESGPSLSEATAITIRKEDSTERLVICLGYTGDVRVARDAS